MMEQAEPVQDPSLQSSASQHDLTVLFMVLAAGIIGGTILQQQKLDYCPNDASRWNTVFYLVEYGTYEYLPDYKVSWMGGRGKRPEELRPAPEKLATLPSEERAKAEKLPDARDYSFKIGDKYYRSPCEVPPFWTIDLIRILDKDGQSHYFSSKPPLLPTVLAGVVWLIEKLTFGHADFRQHPWFMIRSTLILIQLVPLLMAIWLIRQHVYRLSECPFVRCFCLAAASLGTYLTAWSITLNNHVIAACTGMVALDAAIRIWYDGRREWHWFALAGFFAAFTAAIELPAGLLAVGLFAALFHKDRWRTMTAGLIGVVPPLVVALVSNYLVTGSLLPAYTQINTKGGYYDFPGSYWGQPSGLDALSEPKAIYLMHILVGHHGFFLLTPVFLLSFIGIVDQLVRQDAPRRALAWLTLIVTVMTVAVYTKSTNNYGGTAEGFRWLFWVIPMWLLFLPMGLRIVAHRSAGRALCYCLLAISMVSVGFALRTPWADSWAHLLFRQLHWIRY